MAEAYNSRIEFLRQCRLEAGDKKLVEDVEKYGCHIINVREENGIVGWGYTIGVYETVRQPEIIVVGLKPEAAHSVLNDCAGRLKGGARFEDGQREKELLTNVECEFRKVDRRWLRQLMGYAVWFYGDDDFPAVQCIYPDLNNHFPWEEGFDSSWRNRQALLFGNLTSSRVETDLWAANDPESSLFSWKFPDPPHTGVYTTKLVMSDQESIVYVSHDAEDGAWQFHGTSESKIESASLVCFHHIVDKDSSIKELADLPRGWCAWRDAASDPWIREEKKANADQD
jgi:Domain of unknown function (DUF4262)